MKTYITRINGWSLEDKSHYMQHIVAEIARQLGCQEMGIYRYGADGESEESLSSRLDGIIAGINWGDLVICQFPTGNGIRFERELVDRLKAYGGRVAVFIHEPEALVYEDRRSTLGETVGLYNQTEVLIVPTYAMQQWLMENGIRENMKFVVQEMWDCTVGWPLVGTPVWKKEICFADGERFAGMDDWNYSVPLNLYNISVDRGNVRNLREREPYRLLSELNRGSGFGLVWYRDEDFRRYMERSNSFCFARYLAAGLPVIVPAGCSHQTLVEANHLGVVVNSLEEAVEVIERMTEEEYREYVKAVEQFAPALRNGYFTKRCLIETMQAFCRKDAGRVPVPEGVYEAGECRFDYVALNESYGGNLAFSWDFHGEADGFLIYDGAGNLLRNTRDLRQHYLLLKGRKGENGIIVKAYVETLRGKLVLAESELACLRERSFGSPKVSMVIPAYNAEDYIARCIDTALAQSLPDVEIVVVDDGSKDSTPEIIDWYVGRYDNVVAIHQENGGVAAARNTGIKRAKGEYIGFMDNDDMIRPGMAESLYGSAVKNDCDIAMTSVYWITGKGYEVYLQYQLEEDTAIPGDAFLRMLNAEGWGHTIVVWNKLYKSSLIKDRIYPLIMSDDSAWIPYILSYADKVCYQNDFSYEYDRIIRPYTLVDQWQYVSKEGCLKEDEKSALFYLKNGNPERMDLLKDYARKELLRLGKVHAYYEAYEELWQQLDAEF